MAHEADGNSLTIPPPGTFIVTHVPVRAEGGQAIHSEGVVAVIFQSPCDNDHAYRVRFADGSDGALRRAEFSVLKDVQRERIAPPADRLPELDLRQCVIYRCVVGSRAYGLAGEESDVDRRGIYLPPAEMQWSLWGVPEQLENNDTQECYWELQKFLTLALKANPNVLECLYTPMVEYAAPLAQALIDMRDAFLSKLLYQTYNGYVFSQFRKLSARLRADKPIKWKHAMHLIRLLQAGIVALRERRVPVLVEQNRARLLAIRNGEVPWSEIDAWRMELHQQFDAAYAATSLPDRPDYEAANALLVRARRSAPRTAVASGLGHGGAPPAACDARAAASYDTRGFVDFSRLLDEQPYPLLFATISGAHLYGFPSCDSDFDLRGVHILPVHALVALRVPDETLERSVVAEGVPVDLVTHDAAKFFRMLLKRNGYVLEQLFSPLVLRTSPAHEELKQLARGCITRHHAHHYLGFARTQWSLFAKEGRVKPLLYTYRVLLTGIHLMQTGIVEANLARLNEAYRLAHVEELIGQKTDGLEHAPIRDAQLDFHEREYRRLTTELEAAHSASTLPDEPPARDALNDLLVRLRLSQSQRSR